MAKKDVVQYVSFGLLNKIDNFALQRMMQLVGNSRMKEEDFYEIELRACPHEEKQRIKVSNVHEDGFIDEECVWCEAPIDEQVYSYKYLDTDGSVVQLFCLESEGLALIGEESLD